jgi:trehalose/maltose hydrolase-like predicted phosphorylase
MPLISFFQFANRIIYTELANCPDWLSLMITVDGERFRLDRGEILHYERQMDLHDGVLSRSIRWRSPNGKTIEFRFERFASLDDRHVLALLCQITPIDFSGTIEVQSSLNGYADTQGFDHWEQIDRGQIDQGAGQGVWLQVRTRSSHIDLSMAFKLTAIATDASFQVTNARGDSTLKTTFSAIEGQTISLEKVVTVFTSQDVDLLLQAAQDKLARQPMESSLMLIGRRGMRFGSTAISRSKAIS